LQDFQHTPNALRDGELSWVKSQLKVKDPLRVLRLPKEEGVETLEDLDSSASQPLGSLDSSPGKWWKTIKDTDPITLEPLSALKYEPFNLPADDNVPVLFDPRVLGVYLLSTGQFVHPVSRRAMTLEDCQALDLQAFRFRLDFGCSIAEAYKRVRNPTRPRTGLEDFAPVASRFEALQTIDT